MFWRGPDTRHPPIIPVGNFTSNNDLPPGAVDQSDYCPDCQAKLVMRKQDKARFCGACGRNYPEDLERSLQQQQPPQSELTNLHDEIVELRAYIKTLVTQVQLMRQELQKKN
jgi:DNA-directed RNA polymerase subunit M/transcription elongation factor TFIIS